MELSVTSNLPPPAPLPWWEGLGEGDRRVRDSPHPHLTSPIKGEELDTSPSRGRNSRPVPLPLWEGLGEGSYAGRSHVDGRRLR